MKILSVDFESSWTSPVNPAVCRITEIGAVLYDTELKRPLRLYSDFIYEVDHPTSPKELVDLTGITDDMRKEHGVSLMQGFANLNLLISHADYIIAHNGNDFDKPLLYAEAERFGWKVISKPWLDSKTDIEYPPHIKTSKLTYLCSELGFVNPFSHRALFDALSVIKIMSMFDINKIVEQSKLPTVKVIAQVSFDKKHLARERGYYWDGENKYWWKSMKEPAAMKEQNEAPFPVNIRS